MITELTEWFEWFKHSEVWWLTGLFGLVFSVVALGALANWIVKKTIVYAQNSKSDWDDVVARSIRRPLTFLIWIVGISYIIIWYSEDKNFISVVGTLRELGVAFCLLIFTVKFINGVEKVYVKKSKAKTISADIVTIRAVSKLLKASFFVTAALVALETMGVSISGLLAFGGIGGIVIGFAAKDLLSNFFGGLMIYLDRPFKEGEWIRSPDKDLEGTVEDIGWRLTKIMSFSHYPIYVPNATFMSITVENPSRMHHRRINERVGVRYDDMETVAKIATEIKQMMENHDEIDSSTTMIINVDKFADSAVEIMVYGYTKTTEWVHYHQVKQDLMLKIADIVKNNHAEIAFPTRTVHLAPELLEATLKDPRTNPSGASKGGKQKL